jgi:hypothetical protein
VLLLFSLCGVSSSHAERKQNARPRVSKDVMRAGDDSRGTTSVWARVVVVISLALIGNGRAARLLCPHAPRLAR